MSQVAKSARLGRYEQLEVIGEGAYGIVYKALDLMTGEHLALKELRDVDPQSLARFKLEFRSVQEIHHPNLVRLDQLFEEDGKWLIAMELVPGEDLLAHVYCAEAELGFDEPRLRAAFCQLADGLSALHSAGLLHRDLKPSNVRVTPAGRVVVLDFGVTAALEGEVHNSLKGALGTVAYMAPEQTLGHRLSPAADWYAFGVCMYEALTGFRPFDTLKFEELLHAKLACIPDPPSTLLQGLPDDLEQLCVRLLSIDPEKRPNASEVRRALGTGRSLPASSPGQLTVGFTRTSHFEGRMRELAELDAALRRVERGRHQLILIEGESGIGKSALISQFLRARSDDLAQSGGYVLRSRCYENELLAYKAFDGAIEGLARILEERGDQGCRQILPPRAALLCRLFPSLSALPALSSVSLAGLPADPTVQRLQAFSVLRRLLSRLSDDGVLVLTIEDLQWADAESFSLLRALLDGPESVRCLILATVRPTVELDGVTAEAVAALRALEGVTTLPLTGLAGSDAWRLVRELVPPHAPESWLETIVQESAGHPLFMSVLARYAARNPHGAAHELTLEAAIEAELDLLTPQARSLVDATAAAGGPIAPPLCGRVAGLDEGELGPLLADLCNRKLLRRRSRGDVACFHDRIRTVTTTCLPELRARSLHAQLAHVLGEQPGTDPAVLARHHQAAGQLALAFEQFERAADQAGANFAFARAAMLYARALEIAGRIDLPKDRCIALRSARGDALARSGRSTDAAYEYLAAAKDASGEQRMRLRMWATRHLLQSAQVAEGMSAARELLEELDLPLSKSQGEAITRVVWDRAVLRFSGMMASLRPRSSSEPPHAPARRSLIAVARKPAENSNDNALARMRMDALHGLAMPVQWVDPFAGYAMSLRYIRLARSQGDHYGLARAIADHAFGRSLDGASMDEVHGLLEQARQLAGSDLPPELEVELLFREGSVATSHWNLPLAREKLEHAQRLGTERCPDQPWLLTHVRTNLGSVLANLGEHAVLADLTAAWISEARDRQDEFARATLEGLGYGFYRHLMIDEPERAAQRIEESMSPWPAEPFSFAHFGRLLACAYIEQYRGGESALRWLDGERERLSRAVILRGHAARSSLQMIEGTAMLSAHSCATPERAQELRKKIRRITRQLEGSAVSPISKVARLSLGYQLAALDGDREGLRECLQQLRALPAAADNPLHQIGIVLAESWLEGSDEARQRALSFGFDRFSEQGWKKPKKAVAMFWPGIAQLMLQSQAL